MSTYSNDFIERLCFHFYDDYDQLQEHFRTPEINRIMRLRELDREIMHNPGRPDKERVKWLKHKFAICDRQAYMDLQDLRIVAGVPTTYNKEYDRLEMMQLLRERISAAAAKEDDNAVARLMKEYNVMARFGKDEPLKIDPSLAPMTVEPTSDPTVLGLPPLSENEEEMKKRIRLKYDKDYAKDVEYEEIKIEPKDPFLASPLRAEKTYSPPTKEY